MSKTPVSILQELMTKRSIVPNYELLANSEGLGTHIPTFYYRVIAEPVQAVGRGRSKKEAKHEAARMALEKLAEYGYNVQLSNATSSPIHSGTPDPGSPSRVQINAIGALQELCADYNIPSPEFRLIADVGPAHLRQFTVECKVATMVVTATDLTKKKARQTAAQKMLHRLIDTLPEDLEEMSVSNNENFNQTIEVRNELGRTYNEMSAATKRKINLGMRLIQAPKTILNIMAEKDISHEELWAVRFFFLFNILFSLKILFCKGYIERFSRA